MPFAEKILSLYPGLVRGGEGMPDVESTSISATQVFERLPWSSWKEAQLLPVVRYLRGNKHLQVPAEWLEVFPKPSEWLEQRQQAICGQG